MQRKIIVGDKLSPVLGNLSRPVDPLWAFDRRVAACFGRAGRRHQKYPGCLNL
jgi:hypothetical protein